MKIFSWKTCHVPIFQKMREICNDDCVASLQICLVPENENHLDAFSISGNILYYDEFLCRKFNLTDDDCIACIAHEIGHLIDSTQRTENNGEEREFNADKYVYQLGLGHNLISALNKMCPNDEITHKRITALEKQ